MQNTYKDGFTLLELISSVVIIIIISTLLANTMAQSLKFSGETQDIAKARELAQRYVETIKSDFQYTANYDDAIEGTSAPIAIDDSYTADGYFDVDTLVTDIEYQLVDSVSIPVLKEIDVEYKRASDSHSMIKISTLISRKR